MAVGHLTIRRYKINIRPEKFRPMIFQWFGEAANLIVGQMLVPKFYTLLLDKIDSWLNERFFFFNYNLFYKPKHGLIFTENRTALHTTLPKIQILIFKDPLFNHTLYSLTNRKYLIISFRIKLSRVILVTARILFSKGSPKTSSQRLNYQYFLIIILWNFVKMLIHMPKVRIK